MYFKDKRIMREVEADNKDLAASKQRKRSRSPLGLKDSTK